MRENQWGSTESECPWSTNPTHGSNENAFCNFNRSISMASIVKGFAFLWFLLVYYLSGRCLLGRVLARYGCVCMYG